MTKTLGIEQPIFDRWCEGGGSHEKQFALVPHKEALMTVNEVAVLREQWQGQTILSEGKHFALELAYSTSGDSGNKFMCMLCGEDVARSI